MNHPILFSICAFLMLMLLLSWVGYRLIYRPGRFMRQLGTPVISEAQGKIVDETAEPAGSSLVTLLHQIGSRGPSSDAEVTTLKMDLVRAGFRGENTLPVFYGLRIVATLMMLFFCIMLEAKMPPNPVMNSG